MTQTPDLFASVEPECGACALLNPVPIESGIRHCGGWLMWRWAWERVANCPYRTPAEVALSGASIDRCEQSILTPNSDLRTP